MNHTEIRPLHHDDLPALLRLFAQPDMDGDQVLPESGAREVLDRIARTPGHRIYVAEINGEIVGTFTLIFVRHLSHGGGCSGVIEDVVVRSDRQGEGIGRAMMEYAAGLAREAGCYKLVLSSGLHRPGAHAFYEGLGYERHGVSFLLRIEPAL